MSINFSFIPYEIWLIIASFLPPDHLLLLSIFDPALASIATAARYEAVTFSKNDKKTKGLCRQILSDQGINHLVRRVAVMPWLIQPRAKPPRTIHEKVWHSLLHILDRNGAERKMLQQSMKRMEKDIALVSHTILHLQNLSEYSLGWDDKRPHELTTYSAFLFPVLSKISDKIVKLSLNVPLKSLRALAGVSMPRLEHLDLALCTQSLPKLEIDHIFDFLTVFVNNLDRTLRSLVISSRSPSTFLDLTRLFRYLGSFPRLDRFSLTLPFEGACLTSPDVLAKFLDKHRNTLRYFQLGTVSCTTAVSRTSPKSHYWVTNILQAMKLPYPQLTTVRLALRPLKADLTPIVRFLKPHARQIDFLCLMDRVLEYKEVMTILDGISQKGLPQVRRLEMRAKVLTPALLGLLASRLPNLTTLELDVDDVGPSSPRTALLFTAEMAGASPLDLFTAEALEMRPDFAQWNLQTLGISSQSPYQSRCLQHLSAAMFSIIPTLRDFVRP